MQGYILNNKKITFIAAGSLIILLVFILASISLRVIFKKQQKKEKSQPPLVLEEKKKENKTEQIPFSLKEQNSLTPKQLLENKEELFGTEIEPLPAAPKPKQALVRKGNYKKETLPVLMRMFNQALEKGDEGLLNWALKGLDYKGEDAVILLREKIISNPLEPSLRRNAVLGLFYSAKEEAVPVLKTVIKIDPDERVRLAALFALDSICGKEELDFIREVSFSDSSQIIRDKARQYLDFRNINQ